jgi:hypothetical protein
VVNRTPAKSRETGGKPAGLALCRKMKATLFLLVLLRLLLLFPVAIVSLAHDKLLKGMK